MSARESVWLVTGTTGGYREECEDWIVCWLPTKPEAEAYVAALNAEHLRIVKRMEKLGDDRWDMDGEDKAKKILRTKLDPQRQDHYGGMPTYGVLEIKRGASAPEPPQRPE